MAPQKNALLINLPLLHEDSEFLEIRAGGKSWPAIKLRIKEEIDHILQILSD